MEQTGSVDLSEVSGEEWAAEVALAPETTEDADKADRASGKCYVYVCGEVAEPGVYVLETGDRIYEAVGMPGRAQSILRRACTTDSWCIFLTAKKRPG